LSWLTGRREQQPYLANRNAIGCVPRERQSGAADKADYTFYFAFRLRHCHAAADCGGALALYSSGCSRSTTVAGVTTRHSTCWVSAEKSGRPGFGAGPPVERRREDECGRLAVLGAVNWRSSRKKSYSFGHDGEPIGKLHVWQIEKAK